MDTLDYVPTDLLGIRLDLFPCPASDDLPRFMHKAFAFRDAQLEIDTSPRFHLICAAGQPDLRMSLAAMDALGKADQLPCALCSPLLDGMQQRALARRGRAFIRDGSNLFLPFLGMALNGVPILRRRPFSPQAQRILSGLFGGGFNGMTAGELSMALGKSRASVSKYLCEIEAVIPGCVKKDGTRRLLYLSKRNLSETLSLIEPYLANPVASRLVLDVPEDLSPLIASGFRIAGETALSMVSDLAQDSHGIVLAAPVSAIDGLRCEQPSLFASQPEIDGPALELQGWRYWDDFPGPEDGRGLEAVGGLSLLASMLHVSYDEDDVRLMDAIDQLRRSICLS